MDFNEAMTVADVGEWLIEKGFSAEIQAAFESKFGCISFFEFDHAEGGRAVM